MAVTQIQIYNRALGLLGERLLASLSEAREPRRILDDIWAGEIVRYCLERGQWNFAARTSMFEYSPSVEPPFGPHRAFDKPTDWVRTLAVSADPSVTVPLQNYRDDAGFWFAYIDVIYVRYVSDDASYGLDLSLWPETFSRFVAASMAEEAVPRLTMSEERAKRVALKIKSALSIAVGTDSASGPNPSFPSGDWARARMGGGYRSSQG